MTDNQSLRIFQALDLIPAKMQWTTQPPNVEGWYWAYGNPLLGDAVEIVRVFHDKLDDEMPWGVWSHYADEENRPLSFFTHWLGPLPIPAPPHE